MSTTASDAGPLDGIVVVDLSRALAGPHAAMMLGDQGARVIKIEAPVDVLPVLQPEQGIGHA
jgi:crotonobetainyl-CoA:carnitine CoA-transferase CaiB-like acyl-CoA transferase